MQHAVTTTCGRGSYGSGGGGGDRDIGDGIGIGGSNGNRTGSDMLRSMDMGMEQTASERRVLWGDVSV